MFYKEKSSLCHQMWKNNIRQYPLKTLILCPDLSKYKYVQLLILAVPKVSSIGDLVTHSLTRSNIRSIIPWFAYNVGLLGVVFALCYCCKRAVVWVRVGSALFRWSTSNWRRRGPSQPSPISSISPRHTLLDKPAHFTIRLLLRVLWVLVSERE